MPTTIRQDTVLIPVDFALSQIESVDVPASLKKLRLLQQELMLQALTPNSPSGIQITDAIKVTLSDTLEIFSGEYGDIITAKGVALIQLMYQECYLEINRPPTPFPASLIDYMNSGITSPHFINKSTPAPGYRMTDISEDEFSYTKLFYLFESLIGSKQGKSTLNIQGKIVTRTTSQQQPDSPYETVFIWENDACRTQYLTRNGIL